MKITKLQLRTLIKETKEELKRVNEASKENKKYILTDEKSGKLSRIKAVKSFGSIKEGDLGGWIESEENLSHKGNCWVLGKAKVYDKAKVFGNAQVYGKAEIYGKAQVYGKAEIYKYAQVYGKAKVYDNAVVYDNAEVYDSAKVYNNARVCDNAEVYGGAKVYDNSEVLDSARVYGKASISQGKIVDGKTKISGKAKADYAVEEGLNKKKGKKFMKITKLQLRTLIREAKEEYREFFKKALEKFDAKSPSELDDEKKKEFFDYMEKNWNAADEKGADGVKEINENIKFNFGQMMKMINSDDFLEYAFKTSKGKDSDKAESLFNSHILGHRDMEKKYNKIK